MCLDFCRPAREHRVQQLEQVLTPLSLEAWERALALHPDQALARYICNGLRCGFRVGFQHSSPLKSAPANMLSANQHPEVISERSLRRKLGPFSEAELGRLPPLHINSVGSPAGALTQHTIIGSTTTTIIYRTANR